MQGSDKISLILTQKVCKRISLNGCFRQDRVSRENNISTAVAANQGAFGSA